MALSTKVFHDVRDALLAHLNALPANLTDVNQITITYGDLCGKTTGKYAAQSISRHLTSIGDACQPLPRLDVFVVNRKTKRPGRNFGTEQEWQKLVMNCYWDRARYES